MRQWTVNQISFHSFLLGASGGLFSTYRQTQRGAKVTGFTSLHCSSFLANNISLSRHISSRKHQTNLELSKLQVDHFRSSLFMAYAWKDDEITLWWWRCHRLEWKERSCHFGASVWGFALWEWFFRVKQVSTLSFFKCLFLCSFDGKRSPHHLLLTTICAFYLLLLFLITAHPIINFDRGTMCRIAVRQPLAFGAGDFYWRELLIVFLDPAVGRARLWLWLFLMFPLLLSQSQMDGPGKLWLTERHLGSEQMWLTH